MEHRIAEGAAELSRVFPYVESEVLEGLLESMEGALTEDLLQQIEELEIEATGSNIRPKLVLLKRDGPKSLIVSSKGTSKMPTPVTPGCILIFVDPDVPEDDGESGGSAMGCPPLRCVTVSGPGQASFSLAYYCFVLSAPGVYNLQGVLADGTKLDQLRLDVKPGVGAAAAKSSPASSATADKKERVIRKESNEAAAQVLLAAATMTAQSQALVHSTIMKQLSPTQNLARDLKLVFPSLGQSFILAMLESQDGAFSKTFFEQLRSEVEKNAREKASSAESAQEKGKNSKSSTDSMQTTSKSPPSDDSTKKEDDGTKTTIAKDSKGAQEEGGGRGETEKGEQDSTSKNPEEKAKKKTKKTQKKQKKEKKEEGGQPMMIKIGKNMAVSGPSIVSTGAVIPIVPERKVKSMHVEIVSPSGRVSSSTCVFLPSEFGSHTVKITCDGKSSDELFRIVASSAVYEYADSLDKLYDTLFWSWEGNWHGDVENSVVQLVLAVEDNLKKFIEGMNSMLKSLGQDTDTNQLLTTLQENMGDALQTHDKTAMGRLHQAIYQFLEIGMMPWPQSFKDAVAAFERVKFQYSNKEKVMEALLVVQASLKRHLGSAEKELEPSCQYVTRLKTAMRRLDDMIGRNTIDLSLMWELRPKPFENLFAMFGGQAQDNGPPRSKIKYLPSLELKEAIGGGKDLDQKVSLYNEVLLGDAMMVGSMLGYEVGHDVAQDRRIIQNLLFAGFGYLTTRGGKIIPTLNSLRAVLPLTNAPSTKEAKGAKNRSRSRSPAARNTQSSRQQKKERKSANLAISHKKLKKRGKDVSRMLRNAARDKGSISFRVNTDFKQTMRLLTEHHKDSWVGPKLQAVWEVMFKESEMLVFELWYGGEMIAADIAHRVGRSIYVATRFFQQSYRKLQPGFLLALVETKFLAEAGFVLWDLGGTDSSPMMAYKEVVSFQMSRPEFLAKFLPVRAGSVGLKTGIIIDDVKAEHLLC